MPDTNWLRSQDRMSFTPGQEWAGSTEKICGLHYSEVGQTLASINVLMGSQ